MNCGLKLPFPWEQCLVEPLAREVLQNLERLGRMDDVQRVALLPDVHWASETCVGAVTATSELLLPSAVGGDIGCGMAAVPVEADAELLANAQAAARVLAGLGDAVPVNRHRRGHAPASAQLPDPHSLSDEMLTRRALREGRYQCGTLGRGNHFLELQRDAQQQLWVLVHSGSRAMGQAITAHHVHQMDRSGPLASVAADSPAGRAYLADATWARQYAAINRLEILRRVERLLERLFGVQLSWSRLLHNDHNHVTRETHHGTPYWVHRKGAQSAAADALGIIPGSMGTPTFHVRGRGNAALLGSCSHGAGRALSRTEARRRVSRRQFERQLGRVWFDHRRINALTEEAPVAYRDVRAVVSAQRDLIRVERELHPVLNYKGR